MYSVPTSRVLGGGGLVGGYRKNMATCSVMFRVEIYTTFRDPRSGKTEELVLRGSGKGSSPCITKHRLRKDE